MSWTSHRLVQRLLDPLLFLTLVVGYTWLLLATTADLGYARDEGFYFDAARSYERWFALLSQKPDAALERAAVDRYWRHNNEHPALIKSLFALSHQFLWVKHKVFSEEGTSFRFPGMVLSALAVGTTYLWGRQAAGEQGLKHPRLLGLVAGLLLALMPRVFYHSHLDCFDMPVAAMWLMTTYAYWKSISKGGVGWALTTGVLYGLLLNTKHNSWLLPFALVVHLVAWRGPQLFRELRRGRFGIPSALVAMAVIGPLLFYATWPWLWFDTGKRLVAYVQFHLHHDYYNMEFLGRTHWMPPMPRGYAPLMTLATVPSITLLLFGIGLVGTFLSPLRDHVARLLSKLRRKPQSAPAWPSSPTALLWLLCIVLSYAPWLSSDTPIFGGTKHWITAYPFLCLFAARGFGLTLQQLEKLTPAKLRGSLPQAALFSSVLVGPLVMTLESHPWGLSSYVPLAGGAPGAATLGLNRTFWGYTTGSAQGFLNERAPPNTRVFIHDTAGSSWNMMSKDGRLRKDLRAAWRIESSGAALYHHEPHMSRVEYQLWLTYGTQRPAWVGTHHGVPVVWLYLHEKKPPPKPPKPQRR